MKKQDTSKFVGVLISRKDGSTVHTTGCCKTWDGAWKKAAAAAPRSCKPEEYTCRVVEGLVQGLLDKPIERV